MRKIYIFNPSRCAYKIDNYLKSIIGNSVVTYDEIIDIVAKSYNEPTNFNKKKVTYKIINIFLSLPLITISVLIIVRIYNYYYLIKLRLKQKHTLPYCHSNNKSKEIHIKNTIQK